MKITFLLPGIPWKPVGGYRVVYEYASRLVCRGHQVSVVHARRMPPDTLPSADFQMRMRRRAAYLRDLVAVPQVGWHRIDPRVRLVYAPNLLPRYVPDADVVIATWWGTAESVIGYPASKGLKAYLIQSYDVWGGPAERVDATWRSRLFKVVIAEWLLEKGLELGVPPDDIAHVPNGLDTGVFRLVRPIAARSSRVAMLYSSMPSKGFADGLQALERAKRQVPAMEAVLFGTEAAPRRLPGWIRYVRNPPQKELVEHVYNGSAIYLCPSYLEGWHLPPAEAMACGCAVVSTDIGGVRDYARAGETALLAPPGEPAALADHLVALLTNTGERVRLAEAGYLAIRDFDWEASTELLEALLKTRFERAESGTAATGVGAACRSV